MSESKRPSLRWDYLGLLPYQQAWDWQRELREQRIQGQIPDTLLLLQHPPTITLGRNRGEESLLLSPSQIEQQGVSIIRSDRGGDATLHSPGQLVGYLIVDLTARGLTLPRFVEAIARTFVDALGSLGVQAHYDTEYPGVWVDTNKIVAFGLHLRQGVTMHGFAFNITTELSLFDLLVPCGIRHRGVTSVQRLLPDLSRSFEDWSSLLAHNLAQQIQLDPVHHELSP